MEGVPLFFGFFSEPRLEIWELMGFGWNKNSHWAEINTAISSAIKLVGLLLVYFIRS